MTIPSELDLSRVSHLEARKLVAECFDSIDKNHADRDAATNELSEKISDLEDEINRKTRTYREHISAEMGLDSLLEQFDALQKPFELEDRRMVADMEAKLEQLGMSLEDDFQLSRHDYSVYRCYLTNLPLLAGDECCTLPDGNEFLFDLLPIARTD